MHWSERYPQFTPKGLQTLGRLNGLHRLRCPVQKLAPDTSVSMSAASLGVWVRINVAAVDYCYLPVRGMCSPVGASLPTRC